MRVYFVNIIFILILHKVLYQNLKSVTSLSKPKTDLFNDITDKTVLIK